MKRLLIPIAISALLWVRQIRFERRLSRRQGAFEREAGRSAPLHAVRKRDPRPRIQSWNEWGDELVRKVGEVLQR